MAEFTRGGATPGSRPVTRPSTGSNVRSGRRLEGSDIEQILRQLGLSTIPTAEASLSETIRVLLAQAQGSPAEIRTATQPQIAAIRTNLSRMFDSINQRLGRFGGGQVQRERGRALGQAGEQLQNVFATQPLAATQPLLQTLRQFAPTLLAQPPLQTASQVEPFNLQSLGQAVPGLINFGRNVFAPNPPPFALPQGGFGTGFSTLGTLGPTPTTTTAPRPTTTVAL